MKFDAVKLYGNEIQNTMTELCLVLFYVRVTYHEYIQNEADKVQVV